MAQTDTKIRVSLIDGVTRSLTEIQRGVTGLGASIAKVNQAAELTGRAFGVLGAAVGGIADAASAVGGVEDALTRVATVTRATTAEQEQLRKAIDDALTTTRFGADEASNALLLLAKDGLSATEAAQNLGDVLAYAQANAQSAAQAAQGLGAVLDSFGAPAAQIGALADALTATAQAAGTSTEALQQGLAGVGVEATNAGLSLQQTLGILGQLATRGIEGGAAATALNKALSALQNPGAQLSKVFDELNLTGKSVSEILTTLQGNSAAAEKVLSELGDRPRRALRLLVQEGGGDLKKFAEAINSSAGASEKAAEALNNTFLGSLARIQNQLTLLREDLLAPILRPLADEFGSFANQLREFSQSEAFAKLVEDIRLFASEGIKAVGDFVRDFDFAKALESAQNFVADAKVAFDGFVESLKIVSNTIIATRDGIAAAFETLRPVINTVTELSRRLDTDLAPGLVTAQGRLNGVAEAADWAGVRIGGLGRSADDGKKRVRDLGDASQSAATGIGKIGQASADTAPKVAQSVAALDAFGKALTDIRLEVEKTYPQYDNSKEALVRLAGGATEAAIGLERLQIATLASAQAALVRAGQENTATFRALTLEIGKSEERIRQLSAAQSDATETTDAQTESTQRAAASLRDYAGAADNAGRSAQNLGDSNSQVRESFGNIGAAASSVAVDMGNLSEEYIRQALAAAGASKSIRGYIDTLNRQMEAGIEQQRQVADRLAQQERLNRSLDEEAQALDRLRQQYPAIAENELRKLYEAQKRYTELLERQNKTKREGLDLDQQTAANAANAAGGLGTNPRTPSPAPTPTGTQPAPSSAAGSITVNVSGFVTQDALDEVVNRIRRAGLLAR